MIHSKLIGDKEWPAYGCSAYNVGIIGIKVMR